MNETMWSKFKEAYQILEAAEKVLLVAHVHPDADAMASLGIMIGLLEGLGKDYLAYAKDKENIFSYLPYEKKVLAVLPADLDLQDFDAIVVLDCGSLGRTSLEAPIKNILKTALPQRPQIIEFDHHPRTDNYADLEIRWPQATSNTEVLYHFLRANGLSLNKDLANCLLAGILTDTGNFLYPSTSDAAIKIAAEMLTHGAQLPRIVQNTYQNKDLASMKIWGLALKNLKINAQYNLAVAVLTQAEIFAAIKGLSEEISNDIFGDIVGFLSNLGGVKGILLIRETIDGKLKANLRSADTRINLARLAQVFGGGGHPQASGFVVDGVISKDQKGWIIKLAK